MYVCTLDWYSNAGTFIKYLNLVNMLYLVYQYTILVHGNAYGMLYVVPLPGIFTSN